MVELQCNNDHSLEILKKVTDKLSVTFPEAHQHWDMMAYISKEVKQYTGADLCILPFCHTVEAEAMGADINLGNETNGPRVKNTVCMTADHILALPHIDYSKGRIAEVLKACRALREKGENVVLQLAGPYSIMDALMGISSFLKICNSQPEYKKQIFGKLEKEILKYIKEAKRAGVNLFSYADPAGGLHILGSKRMAQVVEEFTYPMLKKAERIMGYQEIMLLCPQTAFALILAKKAKWEEIQMVKSITYGQACIEAIGKTKFAGQMCMKNIECKLENSRLKVLNLI